MFNGERKVSGAEARRSRLRFDRFCQSPSPPCKAIPTNNASGAAVRGRSELVEGLPEDGLYLRVSAVQALTSVYPITHRSSTHSGEEE